jgi:asparagine synthase (glutamine-hydrolysing)
MGNSIEVRPVLLDHVLVEHALALPDDSKWRNGISKSVLKDATSDLLPPDFFKRSKSGFMLPTRRWLQTDMSERFFDVMNSNSTESFFNKKIQTHLTKNFSNTHKNRFPYLVLVFLEWASQNKIKLSDGNN